MLKAMLPISLKHVVAPALPAFTFSAVNPCLRLASLTTSIPPLNGAIYVHCQILKEVLSSAAEAELAALFHNGKDAYAICNILVELGHPQPSTHIVTDNSTASGIANDTV